MADRWADEMMADHSQTHKWVQFAKDRLRVVGCSLSIPSEKVRRARSNITRHAQSFDVVADGRLLEVMCRHLPFDAPADFPHDKIMIGPTSNFKGKHVPFSLVVVSVDTGAMISLRTGYRDDWETVSGFNFHKGAVDQLYVANKRLWKLVAGPVKEDK